MVPAAALAALLAAFPLPPAAGGRAFAQDLRLDATADSTAFRIGEQVRVTLSADMPAGFVIRNAGPSDSLGGLEVVSVDSGAVGGNGEGADGGGAPFRRVYIITAFDSGTHVLPPFVAYYRSGSDTAIRTALSGPIVFTVRGVDVDTSAEIRAIKPPLGAPLTLSEILPYAGAALAAALLAWLAWRFMKKRRRGEKFIPGPPPRPADELALEALRSVDSEKLWQRGKVKEYHTALSEILRTYVERRFAVLAMESTSDEILSSAPVAGLAPEASGALRDVLLRSDLVKFARFIPPPEHNERSFSNSVEFVELTRRAAPAAGTGEAGGAAGEPAAAVGDRSAGR
jgi:hypothetical protein